VLTLSKKLVGKVNWSVIRLVGKMKQEPHSVSERRKNLIDEIRENQLWGNIHRAALTNPALQEALERVKVIYYLSKENGRSKT
jgi:predicted translin family RNA/ssDNA-binding protein